MRGLFFPEHYKVFETAPVRFGRYKHKVWAFWGLCGVAAFFVNGNPASLMFGMLFLMRGRALRYKYAGE